MNFYISCLFSRLERDSNIELKYGGNLECWKRICAVQNIKAMFWRRAYFLYGKKLLYVQLFRNSVKEVKVMENDFLNTTKSYVNL